MPYALIVAVVLADLFTPPDVSFSATLSVSPALSALVNPPKPVRPLIVGALSVVVSLLLELYSEGIPRIAIIGTEFTVVMVTLLSWSVVRSARRDRKSVV